MTIQSPAHRLRLFILSLSLFCCGIAAAQTTATSAGPPGISVVETRWAKLRHYSSSPPVIAPPVTSDTGMVKPPNDNSDLRRVGGGEAPADMRTKAINDAMAQDFNYYLFIKVKNTSTKKILSVAYDYVFTDPGSKEELQRYSRRGFETIGSNETKWIRSMSQGPPQQVTMAGLKKNERSPFDERAELKCVLFADGTGWKALDTDQKVCDELVKFTMDPKRIQRRSLGVYIP